MFSSKPLLLSLSGLVLISGCSASGQHATPVTVAQMRHSNASQYIKNVVVIVQENRSFENFFAGYPGANAPMTGCALPYGSVGERLRKARVRHKSASGCPAGDISVPLVQDTFKSNPDGQHDWGSSMIDWNNGNMDGFSHWGPSSNHTIEYNYIDHNEIAPYWSMAQQYVLADEMFPTEFGGSFTGHLTLVAGTDDIKLPSKAEVNFPSHTPDDCDSPKGTKSSYVAQSPYRQIHLFQGPFPCFDQFNTIAQVLDNANVSWKIYANRVLDGGFWEPFEAIKYVRYGSDWPKDISAPQTNA